MLAQFREIFAWLIQSNWEMVFLIARVSTLASFEPTTGAIELEVNLLIITWVDLVPSILTSFTVKNDDQPSMYAVKEISVIVEKVTSKRLTLLLI